MEAKEIKILSIDIENFKGIKSEHYDFEGKNVLISGRNKSGKTSIYEAYMWCIFRTAVSGTNENVQPRQNIDGELGEIVHKIKTRVFVKLLVDDMSIILGRTLEENWNKDAITGTTSEYFFNSETVPCGLATYKKHLQDIYDIQVWNTCSNIDNFMRLKVADRRDFLKSISSCKSDEEIAEKYPKVLQALKDKKTIEEFRLECTRGLNKAKAEYDTIPDQQQAMERLRVEVDEEALNKEKDQLELEIKGIDDILQQNAESEVFGQMKDIQNKIMQYQSYVRARQDTLNNGLSKTRDTIKKQIMNCENKSDKAFDRIRVIKENIERYNQDNVNLEKKIKEQESQWLKVDAQQIVVPERCDKCGAPLKEDVVATYIAEANKQKAEQLKAIESNAVELDNRIKENEAIINKADKEIVKINAEIKLLNDALEDYKKALENVPDIVAVCNEDEEYKDLVVKCEKYVEELAELKGKVNEDNQGQLREDKKSKMARLEMVNKELGKTATNDKIDEQLKALEERGKEIVEIMDKYENNLVEIVNFKKERIDYIEKSVSDLFTLCRFRMFEKNLSNDGEKELCTPYNEAVPIDEQNLATKMAMKIDICNGIMKAVDCKFPLFIDNTESIHPLPTIDCQTIILKHVPEQDLEIQVI